MSTYSTAASNSPTACPTPSPKKAITVLLQALSCTIAGDYCTQSTFTEGVYIDYKVFIKHNITLRFPSVKA